MTTALAFWNSKDYRAQIWVVPASGGKSRIHAALTYLFLTKTDYNVAVAFQDEGLMNADTERNKELMTFCNKGGLEWDRRVSYQTNLNRKNNAKTTMLIIDESDER